MGAQAAVAGCPLCTPATRLLPLPLPFTSSQLTSTPPPPTLLRPSRFHVQRFFAALDAKDINKYDPNNHTIGADIPFSQNILVSAARCCVHVSWRLLLDLKKMAWVLLASV